MQFYNSITIITFPNTLQWSMKVFKSMDIFTMRMGKPYIQPALAIYIFTYTSYIYKGIMSYVQIQTQGRLYALNQRFPIGQS